MQPESIKRVYHEELPLLQTQISTVVELYRSKGCRSVLLCGSTKFPQYFECARRYLTLKKMIVLDTGGIYGHFQGIDMSSKLKKDLDKLHFEKIRLADSVLVLAPNGVIGISTSSELWYAVALDKPTIIVRATAVEVVAECGENVKVITPFV